MNRFTYLLCLAITTNLSLSAKENTHTKKNKTNPTHVLASNCAGSTAQTQLDIGGVRTTIMNGGDLWWNLSNGQYEVPKDSGKHSLFAGALWIGALDDEGQVKVASQTYRQSGNDFWPGPINNQRLLMNPDGNSDLIENEEYGTNSAEVCNYYDRHFEVNRGDVIDFIDYTNSENPSVEFPNYTIPASILEYPGNRNFDNSDNAFPWIDTIVETTPIYNLESLAPYRDVDGDNIYNPMAGDYPEFNLDNSLNCETANYLKGDQSLWYVMNDMGNAHNHSGSIEGLGLEIHAQAYAFAESGIDAFDYASFYDYKFINRSHQVLNEMYIGHFVDPDLGNYQDDYVGCDVMRGLGYCYNGDEDDETAAGYGENPPAIGMDFLRGPLADENDGIDNDKDGEVDEIGERIHMSKFYYYDNNATCWGNPDDAPDYYMFLQGLNKCGESITHDGLMGRTPPSEAPVCDYHFPDNTDPAFPDSNWTESTAGNVPADRRFVQPVGAFTMAPGAVQKISLGLVWSRAEEGGAWASVEKLRLDDDLVQEAFDNCFELPCQEPNASLISYELLTENYGLDFEYIVQFTYPLSSLTGNNTQVEWAFGDGVMANINNPIHHYVVPGDYTVYATVSNECGEDTYAIDVHVPYKLHQHSAISVPITRVEGQGNGGLSLELTEESEDLIRDSYAQQLIEYKRNYGPFLVHITNQNTVIEGEYELKVIALNPFEWQIKQLNSGLSFNFINQEGLNEAVSFEEWGFDVQVNQSQNPGDLGLRNGVVATDATDSQWLDFVRDEDYFIQSGSSFFIYAKDWIRSGTSDIDIGVSSWGAPDGLDDDEDFENILNGTWAPYRLVAAQAENFTHGVSWDSFQSTSELKDLNSVNIVFTPNQNLWTRVPVIETGDVEGRLDLKSNPSLDKFGNPDDSGEGFSWFPGYAIDVEKGIRLNMMFGEASDLVEDNGNDMLWNPTDRLYESPDFAFDEQVIFGGRHYIYVSKSKYEGADETLHPQYSNLIGMSSSSNKKRKVFTDVGWVSIPMLNSGEDLLSDEVTVKLRVSKPFEEFDFLQYAGLEVNYQNEGLPLYLFTIDGDYSDLSSEELAVDENRKLLKLINVLGQDIGLNQLKAGAVYFEVYDDGSVEKKIKLDQK